MTWTDAYFMTKWVIGAALCLFAIGVWAWVTAANRASERRSAKKWDSEARRRGDAEDERHRLAMQAIDDEHAEACRIIRAGFDPATGQRTVSDAELRELLDPNRPIGRW